MMLADAVFCQAMKLAGPLEGQEAELLKVLCASAAAFLTARLRPQVTVEDCRGQLVTAASLLALADLRTAGESRAAFKAGDFQYGGDGGAGADCLKQRAMGLMQPWLADGFSFQGV